MGQENKVPHWEHGYRVHGYWLDNVIVGRIGLGLPIGIRGKDKLKYHCFLYINQKEWTEYNLKTAKKNIENEYKKFVQSNI